LSALIFKGPFAKVPGSGSKAASTPSKRASVDASSSSPEAESRLVPLPRRFRLSQTKPEFRIRRFAGPTRHAEQLDGLRVAHLTDLHFGRAEPLHVQEEAVRLANAADPDLVVLTGDFVCHCLRYLDEVQHVLSRLQAPAVAVLGNHDHWSGAQGVRSALRRAGIEVLGNAHTVMTLRHQRLQIVGVDDAYTGHADVAAATRGLRADLPSLGLSHIAEEADRFWSQGVPLVLSGHTHGGQISVGGLHELTLGRVVGHRYIHGLYGTRRPKTVDTTPAGAVYVSAGVGAAVVTWRYGDSSQREVALFELGVRPGSFDEPLAERAPHRFERVARITERRRANLHARLRTP